MLRFLDPRQNDHPDIVAVGEDLSVETLVWAYGNGVFPWPIDGLPLLWFSPLERAVLDFDHLHISRRLARIRRTTPFTFTIDRDFTQVITSCQEACRPGQPGTWITPAMHAAYQRLHRAGRAHSTEAWDSTGRLVGGIYGVEVGGVFSGESMFHTLPHASKLALLHLIDHLRTIGLTWMDIQVMTPHMEALGASVIPRDSFLARLSTEHTRGLQPFDPSRS